MSCHFLRMLTLLSVPDRFWRWERMFWFVSVWLAGRKHSIRLHTYNYNTLIRPRSLFAFWNEWALKTNKLMKMFTNFYLQSLKGNKIIYTFFYRLFQGHTVGLQAHCFTILWDVTFCNSQRLYSLKETITDWIFHSFLWNLLWCLDTGAGYFMECSWHRNDDRFQ